MRTDYSEALAEAKQAKEANVALRQQLGSAKKVAGDGGRGEDQEALQAENQHLDGKLKQLRKFQLPFPAHKEDFKATESVKVSQAATDHCVATLVQGF